MVFVLCTFSGLSSGFYGRLLQTVQLIWIILSFHATSFLHALLSYSLSIRYSNHEFCLYLFYPGFLSFLKVNMSEIPTDPPTSPIRTSFQDEMRMKAILKKNQEVLEEIKRIRDGISRSPPLKRPKSSSSSHKKKTSSEASKDSDTFQDNRELNFFLNKYI